VIKFPEFNLQKGKDGDVVRIYSGWDAKAPLLAEFNGDRPPPAKGVASKTSVVYLVFQSDSRGRSRGFRGLFLNQTFDLSAVPTKPITLPRVTTRLTTANHSLNVTTTPTKKTATPGKRTGTKSSSSPANVIVPVVVAIIIVVAMVTVYCIRRKRMEARVRKALSHSQTELVNNGEPSYHDLNSQEDYDSTEELQDIFPSG